MYLLLYPELYSESSQTSKIKLFAIIYAGFQPLTNFPKSSILDIIVGADYASGIYLNFLSRDCKTISANKDFSRCTFTERSVSNSESKSVTKLEVYSCKNEIFKDSVVKSIVEKGPAMIC